MKYYAERELNHSKLDIKRHGETNEKSNYNYADYDNCCAVNPSDSCKKHLDRQTGKDARNGLNGPHNMPPVEVRAKCQEIAARTFCGEIDCPYKVLY